LRALRLVGNRCNTCGAMSKLLPALVLSAALIGCRNGNVKSAAPPASNGEDGQAAQAAQTRAEVKEAFRHAWGGYVRHAWGHDALLSAYELTSDPQLLALATDLGNRLLPAFTSPTGMPYTHVNLRTGAVGGPVSNPAEIGTLVLEFGVLGKLTHNPVYYDKAKGGVAALFRRASPLGLVGSEIDVETGEWKDTDSHVGGG